MGAVFNVDIIQTTTAGFAAFVPAWPGQIIGTALPASVDYRSADWARPCILLMGNEQAGLPDQSHRPVHPACPVADEGRQTASIWRWQQASAS